jgi:large subunit ribosomal protein L6
MVKLEMMERDVKLPDGVSVDLKEDHLTVSGKKGKLTRKFTHPRVKITHADSKLKVICPRPDRKEMGLVGTWWAHINNMVRGVEDGFHYKMRIIYSHFPIKTSVKGSELVIENFLGERFPRRARILEGVTAKISGDMINLEGIDKELLGQTAANIEKATIVRNYDTRVFQDGIYLVSRGNE